VEVWQELTHSRAPLLPADVQPGGQRGE